MNQNKFSQERSKYEPRVPELLQNPATVGVEVLRRASIDDAIKRFFSPCFVEKNAVYSLVKSAALHQSATPLKIGVLFSGGPAPGGHMVVSGLIDCCTQYHPESRCVGFLDGPKGLLENEYRYISQAEARKVRHTGGFDLLGTGRDKIVGTSKQQAALKVALEHQLDGLVIIGGDDSNTNSAILADYFEKQGCKTQVIGVPKTIDGDLSAKELPISFGFDTATKTYSETIGNIAKDVLSSKKQYFFIRLMGRDASHIALECALATNPNLVLISEEIFEKRLTLSDVVTYVADLVEERLASNKTYGVILLPEGLIEHFADVKRLIQEINAARKTTDSKFDLSSLSSISRECFMRFPSHIADQLLLDRDAHGNISVSKIETAKLLSILVERELKARSEKDKMPRPFSYQTHFCGYEGRCQYPTNFDMEYCASLGRVAAMAVLLHLNGYLVAIDKVQEDISKWVPCCIPLLSMMNIEKRHGVDKPVISKKKVDLHGKLFLLLCSKRGRWRLTDEYLQPGPIQY